MNTGAYISGLAHVLLIAWALFGGSFLRPSDPLPVQTTEVSLISAQEFAAMTLPDVPPQVPDTPPGLAGPAADDAAPAISAPAEPRPEPPQAPPVASPEAESAPQPLPDPARPPDLPDETPQPVVPVAEATPAPDRPSDEPPKPDAAPRIAPTPAPAPPPDSEVADVVTPEARPDETAEIQQEARPATAPEQAAPEIVTEAEKPSRAEIVASVRPRARPARPPAQDRPKPQPQTRPDPVREAIDAAVAAAVAGSNRPAPAVPSGPPLTRGEKDALRVAVERCWNTGSLSSEALRTTVVVAVRMNRDGTPQNGSIRMLSYEGGSETAARKAYEAARRAIIRCGARGFDLPAEKFSRWQDIEMTFNPERMRIK